MTVANSPQTNAVAKQPYVAGSSVRASAALRKKLPPEMHTWSTSAHTGRAAARRETGSMRMSVGALTEWAFGGSVLSRQATEVIHPAVAQRLR